MVAVTPFPPGFEIVQVSGPLIIGYLFQWAFFAALTVQLYLYYEAFPNDRLFTKCLVYAIYFIQLVCIILITVDAFAIFGYGFGDSVALLGIHFAWFTSPIITSLDSLIVQSFYAFRIHMLSKSRIVPGLIVAASLAVSVSGCISGRFTFEVEDVTKLNTRKISISVGVWLVGSALIDIIIAGCMTFYLIINDTGFRQTHALISKLVRLTIENRIHDRYSSRSQRNMQHE
ncbi:hypothetical protein B0H11DRAFT_1339108 [Mycena galericulata]|nr:hypothetical protein B0H11DRAFT_1339108 [Mycena galericulata]